MADSPSVHEESDEQLMQRLMSGDEGAWATLAAKYRVHLVRFCASYLGDAHDAEDIAHDALLRLYRRADTFRPDCSFHPWLFRIARNLCLDFLRHKGSTMVEWTQASSIGVMIEKVCDTTTSPAGKAVRQEVRKRVAEVLRGLPEASRVALTLRYCHGLSTADVATVLGISPGNARTRLYRATMAVRDALLPLLDEDMSGKTLSVFPSARV